MENYTQSSQEKIENHHKFPRYCVVQQICKFKSAFVGLKRETEFIAISITDLFYSTLTQKPLPDENYHQQTPILFAIASIFLASKFNDSHPINIVDTLAHLKHLNITIGDIVKIQNEILQRIDYTIPYQTAYSQLSNKIQIESNRISTQFSLKSVKILLMSVKQYSNLVLDPHFGDEIFDLVWNSKISKRMRCVYRKIIQLQKQKKMQTSKQKNKNQNSQIQNNQNSKQLLISC